MQMNWNQREKISKHKLMILLFLHSRPPDIHERFPFLIERAEVISDTHFMLIYLQEGHFVKLGNKQR